jgi:hypothetical protein
MNYQTLCEIVARPEYTGMPAEQIAAALAEEVQIERPYKITLSTLEELVPVHTNLLELMQAIEEANSVAAELIRGGGISAANLKPVLLAVASPDVNLICTETVTLGEREGVAGATAGHVFSAMQRNEIAAKAAVKED